MDLTRDAMLVSLRINNWSGRRYDREASNDVTERNDADPSAGRFNKRLLPKSAFADMTKTMSKARALHYENSMPWDDTGARLLTVANYDHYTATIDDLAEQLVTERNVFIADYGDNIDQARIGLGGLFRIEDYPSQDSLRHRFAIRYRIAPVPDAQHFIADLAAGDADRVKRDIEHLVQERLEDAITDLYKRLGEAVDHVVQRLDVDAEGKPLIFRNSLIGNIRDLVDIVPRLNIFGDERLAQLCQQVKDRIASVDPDELRPSTSFNPATRERVKRDAEDLAAKFAGYFAPARRRPQGSRPDDLPHPQGRRDAPQQVRHGPPPGPAVLRQPHAAPSALPPTLPARQSPATARISASRPPGSSIPRPTWSRPRWPASSPPAR